MGLGAIVVVGADGGDWCSIAAQEDRPEALLAEPLPYAGILGRSTVERTIERFVQAGVEVVTVLMPTKIHCGGAFPTALANASTRVVSDVSFATSQALMDYAQNGIEHSFVVSANVYAEADLLDFSYFHREARQTATRALDSEGPLDLWVVDCAMAQQADSGNLLAQACEVGASYFIRDYVSRLRHPRDLRQLVSDALQGRCAMRPSGRQVKPGIWIDEGAEVDRRARIVAPAYIGHGSKVREDTLITRFSSIEKCCSVDYGTVIEDSSILAHTHVGIWLDVCHSVANGNKLLNLEFDVLLEISDPSVIRSSSPARKRPHEAVLIHRAEAQRVVGDSQPEKTPTPEWELGANPIQG